MGQASNSGRRASLDARKERAAGRAGRPGQFHNPKDAPPQVGGAFGREGKANRPAGLNKGGGGGGGTHSLPKNSPLSPKPRPSGKR